MRSENEKISPIVCFSAGDWWAFNPQACERKMLAFSKYTRVLYINTVSPSMPSLFSSSFFSRLKRKIPSLLKGFRKPEKNVYVLTPFVIPVVGKFVFKGLNSILLVIQLRILLALLRMRKPILWVVNLGASEVLHKIPHSEIVYDCTDKFDASRYIQNKEALKQMDAQIVERADKIICVSRALYNHYKKKAGEKVYYLSHGVDTKLFSANGKYKNSIPVDLKNISHPIIGYHGSLTEANDNDLLEHCISQRPDWSFVLIGRVGEELLQKLKPYKNVHLLGFKEYEKIPSYITHMDVGIFFWKMSDWIHYSSPLKTKEYLAMGKPIVSVPIPELRTEYEGLTTTCSSKKEYVKAIDETLEQDNEGMRKKRSARVMGDDWDSYVNKCIEIIGEKE